MNIIYKLLMKGMKIYTLNLLKIFIIVPNKLSFKKHKAKKNKDNNSMQGSLASRAIKNF